MSFNRGRGRGRFFGYSGRGRSYVHEPPDRIIELGVFEHTCEGEAVCRLSCEKIPYFNAPIFQDNKVCIGKVDEIFGLTKSPWFTVKLNEGIVAGSYSAGHKFYTDPNKLLPMERFLPVEGKRRETTSAIGRGRGRGGGMRGGRRGGFGGRGGSRFRGRGYRGRGKY